MLESMAALESAADEAATAAAFEALRLSSTSTLVEIAQNPKLRAEIADPAAVQVRLGERIRSSSQASPWQRT